MEVPARRVHPWRTMKTFLRAKLSSEQHALPGQAPRSATRLGCMLGTLALALLLGPLAQAQTILGSTGLYGVMGGGAVTVTGAGTTITGDFGVGGVLTGSVTFGSSGALVQPLTAQNITDFNRVYTGLNDMTMTANLTGAVLGGTGATTLTPGVYLFTSAAALTGNLILDAQNQPNAVWVFQMDSTFNTTAGSSVTFVHALGDSAANYGVYWQVAGASVFGANTLFKGNLISGSTIGLGAGVEVVGRLLTGTGTIDLAGDTINYISASSGYSGGLAFSGAGTSLMSVPEPSTYALITGLVMLSAVMIRRRLHRGRSTG